MRIASYVLLALGLVLAATFGARNGAALVEYRAASALVDLAEDEASRQTALEARDAVGLPEPGLRLAQWFSVGGAGWAVGVLMIGAGAMLARRQQAAETSGEGAEAGRVDFPATLATLEQRLGVLGEKLADLPMDDDAPLLREELDSLATDVILPVVEGRGQLIARHGLARFAEYWGPFSGGERNLGRTWSALTDGHAEVARESLASAQAELAEARAAWERVDRG